MTFAPSAFEHYFFNERDFYIKRDDLLSKTFSGNKARKFYYFLTHDFPHIAHIISYGSNQSNAMYSLSEIARLRGWKFTYFCNHIPSYLKENPMGNYAHALKNEMHIFESDLKREDALKSCDAQTLFIEEGGRQEEAQEGIALLAKELAEDIAREKIENPFIFLPSGTGTTALYLQKHLNIRVYTCPCVGDSEYLKQQWLMVEETHKKPIILESSKKFHYGKVYLELYDVWKHVQEQTGVVFDLVYDPIGWTVLLEHLDTLKGTPIYIHQGGILGNESMEERYKRKML